MASLKEIKNRIASVGSTLKITSAMKMVASAKLHVAQTAIGNLLPYGSRLSGILAHLLRTADADGPYLQARPVKRLAVLAFASNSSLCGAYNADVIKTVRKIIAEYKAAGVEEITVYSVGRKMAEAMRKSGYPCPEDYTALSARPGYAGAAALADSLTAGFLSGKFDKVEIVYTHYKTTASRTVTRMTYLPMSLDDAVPSAGPDGHASAADDDVIVEPDAGKLLEKLLPMVARIKVYTVLLDACEAEHSARTVAMQAATDNGNELLRELTLEFNKGRQQKITSEILDIVGGSVS